MSRPAIEALLVRTADANAVDIATARSWWDTRVEAFRHTLAPGHDPVSQERAEDVLLELFDDPDMVLSAPAPSDPDHDGIGMSWDAATKDIDEIQAIRDRKLPDAEVGLNRPDRQAPS
ncbi:MAG: hypothetical protein PF961_16560 [Planctomycetota bacterium]|jgi:hypothetical protein|nr:hypothetical protein [Planctomycetota bacterium]